MNDYDARVMFYEGMMYTREGEAPEKAIENHERRESNRAARSLFLPKKTNAHGVPNDVAREGVKEGMPWALSHEIIEHNNIRWTRDQYEMLGFKIVDDYNSELYLVVPPKGWTIEPTDHALWNEVKDDKGRVRMNYFYKNSYGDTEAFVNFYIRYNFKVDPCDNYESNISFEDRQLGEWTVWITDAGEKIEKLMTYTPKSLEDSYLLDNFLNPIGVNWLNSHYPNWEDFHAYWDD